MLNKRHGGLAGPSAHIWTLLRCVHRLSSGSKIVTSHTRKRCIDVKVREGLINAQIDEFFMLSYIHFHQRLDSPSAPLHKPHRAAISIFTLEKAWRTKRHLCNLLTAIIWPCRLAYRTYKINRGCAEIRIIIIIMGLCSGTSTEWLFVRWNLDQIRIWKCWFLRRGENRSSRGKTSRSREENQNKLNPHMASSPGIDPEPHRWQRVLSPLRHTCSLMRIKTFYFRIEVSLLDRIILRIGLNSYLPTQLLWKSSIPQLSISPHSVLSSSLRPSKFIAFQFPSLKKKIAVTINSLKSHKIKRRHSTPLNHSFPLLKYLVKLTY